MGHNTDQTTKHLQLKGHKVLQHNNKHNIAARSQSPNQKVEHNGIYSSNTKTQHELINSNIKHKSPANTYGVSQINAVVEATPSEKNNHHTSITTDIQQIAQSKDKYQSDINHHKIISNQEAISRIPFNSKYTRKHQRLKEPDLAFTNYLYHGKIESSGHNHNNYQDCTS
jgi:hypothetical protein